jgi:hypothetical protein
MLWKVIEQSWKTDQSIYIDHRRYLQNFCSLQLSYERRNWKQNFRFVIKSILN